VPVVGFTAGEEQGVKDLSAVSASSAWNFFVLVRGKAGPFESAAGGAASGSPGLNRQAGLLAPAFGSCRRAQKAWQLRKASLSQGLPQHGEALWHGVDAAVKTPGFAGDKNIEQRTRNAELTRRGAAEWRRNGSLICRTGWLTTPSGLSSCVIAILFRSIETAKKNARKRPEDR
jgi:hypothetical protein